MPSLKKLEIKKKQVDKLTNELQNAESIVFADYKGLTVKQDTEMRAEFRRQGLNYKVVKNSISERAFEKLGIEGLEETLQGPTAIAYSDADVVLAPRMMRIFAEKFKKMSVKGGVVGKQVHELDYIMALSRVESRETLYGQLLFMMLYPLTAFVQVASQIAEKGAEAGVENVADVEAGEMEQQEQVAPTDEAVEVPEESAPADEAVEVPEKEAAVEEVVEVPEEVAAVEEAVEVPEQVAAVEEAVEVPEQAAAVEEVVEVLEEEASVESTDQA
jgi:large subunit ribosomal protein L10